MSEAALPSASTAADVDRVAHQAPRVGHPVPGQGARGIDEPPALRDVGVGQEPRHRHLHEARIGEHAVAVVEGDLLGLDEQVHVIGAEILERADVEPLEEAEHLEHGQALGRAAASRRG